MKNSKATPPGDLSPDARRKWLALRDEYEITDEAGLLYLTTACRFYDRMRQAQKIVAKEGTVTVDRFGQSKPHPAVTVERDAAQSMMRAFRALNLDVEPLHAKPGRPPGTGR